jgi:hypothetical protein
MSGSGAPKFRADLNVIGVGADLASLNVVNVVADVNHGAASLTIDQAATYPSPLIDPRAAIILLWRTPGLWTPL